MDLELDATGEEIIDILSDIGPIEDGSRSTDKQNISNKRKALKPVVELSKSIFDENLRPRNLYYKSKRISNKSCQRCG